MTVWYGDKRYTQQKIQNSVPKDSFWGQRSNVWKKRGGEWIKSCENSLKELCNINQSKDKILEGQEEDRKKQKIYRDKSYLNFVPNLRNKTDIQVQKPQRTSSKRIQSESHQDTIIKLSEVQDK